MHDRPRPFRRLTSALFHGSNSSSTESSPNGRRDTSAGIAWIILGASDSLADGKDFDAVSSNALAPQLAKAPGIRPIWRLCNTNPAARSGTSQTEFNPIFGGCCALVVGIEDIYSQQAMNAFRSLPIRIEPGPECDLQPQVPEQRKPAATAEEYGADLKRYALIQDFSPPRPKGTPKNGTCVVAVAIEPADGADELLDSWYRDEHLDLVAKNPVFIRCTRYKLLPPSMGQKPGHGAPRFLALHEYESTQALFELALDRGGALVPETELSRKILGKAKQVERVVWDVYEQFGEPNSGGSSRSQSGQSSTSISIT